jgi:hypothetical protein
MKQGPRYRVRAVFAAAAIGGGLVGLEATALFVWQSVATGEAGSGLIMAPFYGLVAWMMFAPMFLIGLVVLGAPVWWAMENAGIRSARAATAMGTLLTGAAAILVLAALGVMSPGALWFCAAFAPPGAAAGWTLHRVAYGPAKPVGTVSSRPV